MISTRPFPGTKIIVIKEFATKEETQTLYRHLYSKYPYNNIKLPEAEADELSKRSKEIIEKLEKKYIDFASLNLDFEAEPLFKSLKNYEYWEAGKQMPPHFDNLAGAHLKPVMYGCVFYINDDFEGGQLWYPNQGVEYTPVAGEMIIHPGSREYSHGVKMVNSGLRITSSAFIHQKDVQDDNFGFEY